MGQYKKYENLPWWLNSLDDNTLTPTQKEVLDLDYYCLKHGTKLSHEKAAEKLDRGRHTIYTARRRLSELILRTTRRAKGSFLIGNPIEYQNEADWLAVLRARGLDPGRFKMKRKSSQKNTPLGVCSSSKGKNEGVSSPVDSHRSGTAQANELTDRCSGGASENTPTREAKDGFLWEVIYRDSLRRNLDVPYPQEQAEKLARIKADHKLEKRKAEREAK